jgi:hypothetical protein
MPLVLPHAGTVLSHVQLVTMTFDNDAARPQREAFGDLIVGSDWYKSVGLEYGLYPGTHAGKISLGPAPASITRDDIAQRLKQLLAGDLKPKPTATGNQVLYMVYVPPGVARGAGLVNVRGYHDMFLFDTVRVPFVVVLDDGSDLAAMTLNAAHQLINAATNPYAPPMDGYYADPPKNDPWSLIRGEVADLCEGEDPVLEQGTVLPRVYSNSGVTTGKSPCKPFVPDDTWSDVTAEPSMIQNVRRGGSVTFRLTGWSTRELPDWMLSARAADFSQLTFAEMNPEFSDQTINNRTSVTLTLYAPANAPSGATGGVYVLSGAQVHPWAVGFKVQ